MATKKSKFSALATRLNAEEKQAFVNKASKFGGTSYVLRELAIGFTDGRVQIAPPKIAPLFTVKD